MDSEVICNFRKKQWLNKPGLRDASASKNISHYGAFLPLSYKWDGMGWVGWDLCAGLFYEHRFAMLITNLWILKTLVNIENPAPASVSPKSPHLTQISIVGHTVYSERPKIMANICEYWKSWWIFVNIEEKIVNICSFHSGSRGPCLCWKCTQIRRFF